MNSRIRFLLTALLLLAVFSVRAQDALTNGLVAYFPFSGNANDESGNGNHASVSGAVLAPDRFGVADRAFHFNGSSERISAAISQISLGNSARTITAWIKPDDDHPINGVVHHGSGDCIGLMFGIARGKAVWNNGNLGFWGGCRDWQSTLSAPSNQWSFIALTYNGAGGLQLYANGASEASSISSLATQAGRLWFGAETLDDGASFRDWYKGEIDDVRVYNRGLSTSELALLYALEGGSSLTNGLEAYYPFNGNANDTTGNNNHATPAGNYQFLTNGGLTGGAIRIIGDGSVFYSGGGHVLLPAFSSNLNAGFTCSFWVKDEAIGFEPVGSEAYVTFQQGSSDSDFKHWITLNNWNPALLDFLNGNGSGVGVGYTHTIDMTTWSGNWKHIALITDVGRFACYLNGKKIYQTNISYSVFPAPLAALGRHWWPSGSSSRLSATFDNVRIYRRALGDEEVSQLFELERSPVPHVRIAVKTLRVSLFVELGRTYQVESSIDAQTWTAYGPGFNATFSPVNLDVEVLDGKRFFRIRDVTN